jgi:uncharacterized protein YndB with AHSA1/START domain
MIDYGNVIDQGTVRFERLLDGPIERVWEYLTKREYLSTWLGDGDIGEVGTAIALKQEGPKIPNPSGATIVGVVTACDPPRKLSYTWNHMAPGAVEPTIAESHVAIELEPVANRVRLVLTHSGIDSAFTARLCTGWHAFLDILALRMGGEEPPPVSGMFARLLPEYERRVAD